MQGALGHGDPGGQHSVGARIMISRAISHCGSTVYNYRDCNEWSGIKELMKNLPVLLALLLLTRSCTSFARDGMECWLGCVSIFQASLSHVFVV